MVLTSSFLAQIKSDIKTDIAAVLTYGAVGTDSTAAQASDTALGEEVFRDAADDIDTSGASTVVASLIVPAGEGNGLAIAESGWFDTDELAVDTCEAITGWTDSADMTVHSNTTTYQEGSAAIDLTKDAGASATASTTKTTTSIDFTSRTLAMFLYIKDATMLAKLAASNCFTVRFGNDSSNYYQWQLDQADLSVGWNVLNDFTISTGVETGTVTDTSCEYVYVGVTADAAATTWSDGDLIMDWIRVLGGTMHTRNTLTSINKTSDIQLFLDTTITIEVTEG